MKGFAKALQNYNKISAAERNRLEAVKQVGLSLFAREYGGNPSIWEERPLPQTLLDYASCDAKHLLGMKADWALATKNQKVLETTKNRVEETIRRQIPLQGRDRARRDFDFQ